MLSKKKTILFAGAAAILAAVTAVTAVSAAVGTNVLELHGSTTLGPVVQAAATPFNAAAPSGVTIDVAGIVQNSSGAGISDLDASPQLADIAMSSRALSSGNETNLNTPTNACVDAVVMMVNNTNTPASITYLTKQMIRGIYDGVYRLAAAGGDGINEYWDAGSVTVSSAGLPGDDSTNYDMNEYFPALPGHGVTGAHVQIVVEARNLNSGTRAFLGDSVVHGGCAFATEGTKANDPVYATFPYANFYPLEEAFLGTTDTNRQANATAMSTAINNNALGATIGYAGVGYDTGANIRDLKVEDDLNLSSGSWSVAPYNPVPTDPTQYAATNINVYSNHYHLSRYLYLVTKNGDANHANDMVFVNWFETLDSLGQDAAVAQHELRLVPDEDINNDGVVSIYDLVVMGNNWESADPATSGTTHLRSDINRDGTVSIYDLVDLGNWWGVQIQALP